MTSRTIYRSAEPLFEPSPYSQYVLQDNDLGAFWTGRDASTLAGWTDDITLAEVVVGLEGVVEARRKVPTIVEYSHLGYPRVRITFFRELVEPAEQKAVA